MLKSVLVDDNKYINVSVLTGQGYGATMNYPT